MVVSFALVLATIALSSKRREVLRPILAFAPNAKGQPIRPALVLLDQVWTRLVLLLGPLGPTPSFGHAWARHFDVGLLPCEGVLGDQEGQ